MARCPLSGDLVNHPRGTLHLSRLDLVSVALQYFHTRILHYMTGESDPSRNLQSQEGHHVKREKVYALVGLSRARPSADKSDSDFQALTQFSLLDDSDQILELLICMHPKSPTNHGRHPKAPGTPYFG